MTNARTFIAVVLTVGLLGTLDAQQQKFYPDDPLRVDLDNMAVPVEPAEIDLSDMFDRFGHIAADLGSTELTEAHNVNTLDEVPDSSWFTNRHGVERMSIDELVRGPNTVDGPDMSVPWRVFRSKIGGLTPGFQIIDGRGDRYVIKFDPVGVPELSSAAEIIGTKLFYAMGYNTPENYIVSIDPEAGIGLILMRCGGTCGVLDFEHRPTERSTGRSSRNTRRSAVGSRRSLSHRRSVYDNRDDSTVALSDAQETGGTSLALPAVPDATVGSERYLLVEVFAMNDDHPMWNRRVGIYLRPVGEGFELVGVERESDPPDNLM